MTTVDSISSIVIIMIRMSLFESTLLSFYKPQSKLIFQTMHRIVCGNLGLHIYIEQDKNSMMSWSTNFIIAIKTQPIFSTTLSPSSVVQCGTIVPLRKATRSSKILVVF